MSNRLKFLQQYGILHSAAVGVVFIRTREPIRAEDALREWAFTNRKEYKKWSMLTGWGSYSSSDHSAAPAHDAQTKDLIKALNVICNLDGTANANGVKSKGFSNGVFSVFWPHFALPKVPILIQQLLELAHLCADEVKRVALIVPMNFELPPELNEVIPILDFDLPDREELSNALDRTLENTSQAKRPVFTDDQRNRILNAVVGMSELEAEGTIARAIAEHKTQLPKPNVETFIACLMRVKTEALKRSDVLEVMPVENMSNVGGLTELKEWVAERKIAFGPEAREAGVDRPRGFLLVGPPGTGKSLAAKATANELGQSLIKFDISRVYGSLVGQSEGKVRAALKTIEAMAPCVAMVDEIDKAVSSTNSGANDGGISTRILGAILTFMQECQAEVFWVLTANRTQNLPSELVRKGRLDEVFSVNMPAESERRDIIGIHLRKRKEDINAIEDIDVAINGSNGYVGAEIEAAISSAKLRAYRNKTPLTGEMIKEQLALSKPLSEAFKEDFQAMEQWATNNARPASVAANEQSAFRGAPAGRVRTRAGTRNMSLDDAPPAPINSLDS